MKNRIKSIDEGSPLRGKVSEGDSLVSVNGNIIRDVLDYKFFAYDEKLEVVMEDRAGKRYTVHVIKNEGGDTRWKDLLRT